jgi:hypothetical protein
MLIFFYFSFSFQHLRIIVVLLVSILSTAGHYSAILQSVYMFFFSFLVLTVSFGVLRVLIKCLFLLAFPCSWKNLELVPPFLIHVNLECCLALALWITASPTIFCLRCLLNSNYSSDSCLCSCATSRKFCISCAMADCSFTFPSSSQYFVFSKL